MSEQDAKLCSKLTVFTLCVPVVHLASFSGFLVSDQYSKQALTRQTLVLPDQKVEPGGGRAVENIISCSRDA